MEKAFDRVGHHIIVQALWAFGVPEIMIMAIQHYTLVGYAFVEVNGRSDILITIKTGSGQASFKYLIFNCHGTSSQAPGLFVSRIHVYLWRSGHSWPSPLCWWQPDPSFTWHCRTAWVHPEPIWELHRSQWIKHQHQQIHGSLCTGKAALFSVTRPFK